MQNTKALKRNIDWINTLFLFTTPLIALGGTTFLIWVGGVRGATVALSLVMALLTGLAITAGYHRLFSHRSFEANKVFKFITLIFGAAAFENSVRRWASDHRNHHKYVDTDFDPYNIKRGFFFAHMGWVCLKYDKSHNYSNVPDLDNDPLVRFQEKYYLPLGIIVGFFMPMGIATLWGDPWGGLILAGFTRLVLNHHFTFSINSFCHMLGTQPYSEQNSARDSWFMALFTYGEGYHNFHHKFPSDYRNGVKAHHWDPTKWIIRLLSFFGLTHSLRKISDQKILLAKIRMDEKRLVQKIAKKSHPLPSFSPEFVAAARVKFEHAYVHFQTLKAEYERLKKVKIEALNAQVSAMNERITVLKDDLHRARESLREAMTHWGSLCNRFGVRATRAYI